VTRMHAGGPVGHVPDRPTRSTLGGVSSLVPSTQVLVDFAGDGEGTDELSWGQWEIWQAMVDQQTSLPIGGTAPRADDSVDDVAEELRYLMSRYQTMRTRIVYSDDGRPLQSVSAKGQIVLEVFEAGEQDPVQLAKRVHHEYATKPFDLVNEWPMRMAAICKRGKPVQLVAVSSHLTTDGTGGMVMIDEVARRVEEPVDGMQPLEQARWQRSPAGVRQNRAALRYFARQLDQIPLGMLEDASGAGAGPESRYWKGKLRSEALSLAVRVLTARTEVDSSAIMIALYATGFAHATGQRVFFTRPVVSNRFRTRLSNVVCMLAQAGICVIEVAGCTVDEVITKAQRAAMSAYKHAYFHPQQLSALIAETAARRGPSFSASCFFNDRNTTGRADLAGGLPDPAEIAHARSRTSFGWVPGPHQICDRLFLNVEDVPGLIELTVDFDTHHVSPQTVEAMLRAMEEAAVGAASDPDHRV